MEGSNTKTQRINSEEKIQQLFLSGISPYNSPTTIFFFIPLYYLLIYVCRFFGTRHPSHRSSCRHTSPLPVSRSALHLMSCRRAATTTG